MIPQIEGRLLVGATTEDVGYDEQTTTAGLEALQKVARSIFPHLYGAQPSGIRVGLRPLLPDRLPAVGESARARRLFYATGHYRNGVLLAPLTARILSGLILDDQRTSLLESIDPRRNGI